MIFVLEGSQDVQQIDINLKCEAIEWIHLVLI